MDSSPPTRILGVVIPGYLIVAFSSWFSRLLTTAISLLSIRILLDTLGVEHYAAYVVVMGMVGWFMLADFGAGQSLQNYISESRVVNKGYVDYIFSTSVVVLILVALVVAIVVIWGDAPAGLLLSQFKFLTNHDRYLAFTSVAGLVVLSAWGALVYRIWYAEHKGYLANTAATLAALLVLVGVYSISRSDMQDRLLWCLVAANTPIAIVPVVALIIRLRNSFRSIQEFQGAAKKILKRSRNFWLFNIVVACVFQIDYIVLSQCVPADQIVVYSIGIRLFMVAGFLYGAVLQAFWPVCAEALTQGDWVTINTFIKKYMLWGAAFVITFTVCIAMFRSIISSLFSSQGLVTIPMELIVALGALTMIRLWTDVFAVILQSMNDMNLLLIGAVLQAMIGLGLQIFLVPKFGINGTVFALCLSWLLTVSWILPKKVWSLQKKTGERFP